MYLFFINTKQYVPINLIAVTGNPRHFTIRRTLQKIQIHIIFTWGHHSAGLNNGTKLDRIRKVKACTLHLQPLEKDKTSRKISTPATPLAYKYEPRSPFCDPDNSISSLQLCNWDWEPNKKLSNHQKTLVKTETVMGMLQLQKSELDIITISDSNAKMTIAAEEPRIPSAGSRDPYPIARTHSHKPHPISHLQLDSPFQGGKKMVKRKEEWGICVLKRLSTMIPLLHDKEEAIQPLRSLQDLFSKKSTCNTPLKFKFQLDNLDIHHKTATASCDIQETVTVPSSSEYT